MAMGSAVLPETDPEVFIPSASLELLNPIEIPGKDKLHEPVIAGAKHSSEFKEPWGPAAYLENQGVGKVTREKGRIEASVGITFRVLSSSGLLKEFT